MSNPCFFCSKCSPPRQERTQTTSDDHEQKGNHEDTFLGTQQNTNNNNEESSTAQRETSRVATNQRQKEAPRQGSIASNAPNKQTQETGVKSETGERAKTRQCGLLHMDQLSPRKSYDGRGLNPRSLACEANVLTTRRPSHKINGNFNKTTT
jgi:hypothetical protein